MQGVLSFTDRWMFNRVMCDEEVCRDVLAAVLGFEIGRIEYLNAEQAKEPTLSGKGVRMDVFARDSGRVFDIEMQVVRESYLGKRMRYYQAALDTGELGSGEDYKVLPESYIIFVCATDSFEDGLPVYTFERICLEKPQLAAGDDSHWVVLNSEKWELLPANPLRDFLRYVKTGSPNGRISCEIDSRVQEYNRDREWVARVLTFEQDKIIQCNRAREEGLATGMDKLGALIARLLEEGSIEEATRAAKDPTFRDQLLKETE